MTTKDKKDVESKPETGTPTKAEVPQKPQYNKDELLTIFDEMIFSGEYTEDLAFRSGKLKVTFRTRSAEETSAITRDIDSKNFSLITTLQEYRAIQNLAYSLVKYAGNDLSKLTIEDRTKYINKLPAPIVGLISSELNKFDQKIFAACEEGEANF